ncbi:MAG TPA: LytTR family transcriptional regulator [Clostridiales bacterium]|nr:LytTR family transcriptional regulator [Clostridiales bacterium]
MKITIQQIPVEENEIILKYSKLDSEMLQILAFLKESTAKIAAKKGEEIFLLTPDEVYFVDYVDNKTFIYTKDDVLESSESLARLESRYENFGIVRIGKSQLVNLHHVKKLKSILYSRIEITLESGDILIVSRHYAQAFKNYLDIK